MAFLRVVLVFAFLTLSLTLPGEADSAAENPTTQSATKQGNAPAGSAGPERLEDRRWIVKEKAVTPGKTEKNKSNEIKWKGEQQKRHCTALIPKLKDALQKARYHSIQGDPCSTMEYAKRFIDLSEQCKKECPEGYLKQVGYQDQTLRNVGVLYESGKVRCIGKLNPAGPDSEKTTSAPSSDNRGPEK
jgi:hypothetical protein